MTIVEGSSVLLRLSGKNSLLDGKIRRFDIYESDYTVNIDVYVKMRRSADYREARISFLDCVQYELGYTNDTEFYHIPQLKFFQNEEGLFYFSFHPWDETETISENDENLIASRGISLTILAE